MAPVCPVLSGPQKGFCELLVHVTEGAETPGAQGCAPTGNTPRPPGRGSSEVPPPAQAVTNAVQGTPPLPAAPPGPETARAPARTRSLRGRRSKPPDAAAGAGRCVPPRSARRAPREPAPRPARREREATPQTPACEAGRARGCSGVGTGPQSARGWLRGGGEDGTGQGSLGRGSGGRPPPHPTPGWKKPGPWGPCSCPRSR